MADKRYVLALNRGGRRMHLHDDAGFPSLEEAKAEALKNWGCSDWKPHGQSLYADAVPGDHGVDGVYIDPEPWADGLQENP